MDQMEEYEEDASSSSRWSTSRNRRGKMFERRVAKRTREDLDSSTEEEWYDAIVDGDKVAADVNKVKSEMNNVLNDPDRKVSKKVSGEIADLVGDFESIVMKLVSRNAYLKGILDAKEKENKRLGDLLSVGDREKRTYAETARPTARPPPVTGSRRVPQLIKAVVIKPPEGTNDLEGDNLKKKVMEIMEPAKEKIKIKGVRKIRDGGLIIETATMEDLQKVVNNEGLNKEGLKPMPIGSANPKIIIFDVPRGLEVDELKRIIYNQNEDLFAEVDEVEFDRSFNPRFRTGIRLEDTTNWVVEVTPSMRTILRRNDRTRLYVDWNACKVQDYRGVTRCFKCQMYGHIARFCKEELDTCSYCAESGHKKAECPQVKAKKDPICPPCRRAKKNSNHAVGSKDCPAYKSALERIISRTNYGSE